MTEHLIGVLGVKAKGCLNGLSTLTLGFFCRGASASDVLAIVEASQVDQSEHANRGRLHLLEQYVSHRGSSPDLMKALRLAAECFVEVDWNTMDDHVWNQAVGACFEEGSLERAEVLFRAVLYNASKSHFTSLETLLTSLAGAILGLSDNLRWKFFRDHLGPALVDVSTLVGGFYFGSKSSSLLGLFDPQKILAWIGEDAERRLSPIAHSTPVKGVPMPALARELIIKWGGKRDVTGTLAAAFGSGSWVGPRSGYYQHLLDILSAWEKDPSPAVRQFSQTLRGDYEREATEQKKQEEDRGW